MINTEPATVFSIGFTGKSAQEFFSLLKNSQTRRLIDVRLNNSSQLAGFSKKGDLRFFIKEICDIEYIELRELTPEPGPLKDYKNKVIDWSHYESMYKELLARRSVETRIDRKMLNMACLLCSEHKPHYCHRKLALEYLNGHWENTLKIVHLY